MDAGLKQRFDQAIATGSGNFTQTEMESFSAGELLALARAEERAQSTEQTPAELGAEQLVKSAADQMTSAELHEFVDSQEISEAERQRRLASIELSDPLHKFEKECENLTADQILKKVEKLTEAQTILEVEKADPVLNAEQRLAEINQQLQDAAFVKEQIDKSNSKQLDNLVAQKIQENQTLKDQQAQIALNFVASHPSYIQCPENQNAMNQFLESSGFKSYTDQNLELAFTILSQKGLLRVKSSQQLAEEQQIREQIVNPPRQRRSSSVPASTTQGSLYTKREFNEDEAYSMPLEELVKRAGGRVDDAPGMRPRSGGWV